MHQYHEMRRLYIRINFRSNEFGCIDIKFSETIDTNTSCRSTSGNSNNSSNIKIPIQKSLRQQHYTTNKYLIDRMQIKLNRIEQQVKLNNNNNNFNNSDSISNNIKMYHSASSIATNNNTSLIVVTAATTLTAPSPSSTTAFATKNVAAAAVAAVATNQLLIGDKNDTGGGGLFDGSDMNLTFTPAFSQVLLSPTSSTATSSNSSSGDGSTGIGTTTNETEPLNSFYFYQTEQLIVLWILFTIIVLGNSAVLITLFLNKNRKSRMNFFIKQLAIADLCVGLLNVLTDIIWRITVSWRAGNFACKLIRFLQASVTYASTYVLVALSIDRYDAITHPMNFSGSWKRARRLVAAAWVLSAIFSTPMLFLYEETLIEDQTQCWIELGEPWRWQIYMSLVSTVLFVVPALIISACYAIIVRTIWAKGAIYLGPPEHRSRGVCNATGNGYAAGIIDRDRRASSRGIIPRAKVKTVKMTIVIVIVFVLCWSPYIVFDLLQVFQQIPKTQTNLAIATMIQSLAPLNSAANPLIYCLFSTQVCRALKRIPPFRWFITLWCCYGCDKSQHDHRSSQTTIRCNANGQRMNNSNDSMRTLTTSLTTSRRSATYMRPPRVVIVERPKTILAMSEV